MISLAEMGLLVFRLKRDTGLIGNTGQCVNKANVDC